MAKIYIQDFSNFFLVDFYFFGIVLNLESEEATEKSYLFSLYIITFTTIIVIFLVNSKANSLPGHLNRDNFILNALLCL